MFSDLSKLLVFNSFSKSKDQLAIWRFSSAK